MARLEVLLGRKAQQLIELDVAELIIGRGAEAQIVLKNEMVSRKHCRIRQSGGGHALDDLDSASGTTVNGKPVASAPLQDGDRIELGTFTLVYHSAASTAAVSAPVIKASADLWDGLFDSPADDAARPNAQAPAPNAVSAAALAAEAQGAVDPAAYQGTLVAGQDEMARIREALAASQVPHLKARVGGKQKSFALEAFPYEVGHRADSTLRLSGSPVFGKKRFGIDKAGNDFTLSSRSMWSTVLLDGKKVKGTVELKTGSVIEAAGVKFRFGKGEGAH